MLCVPVHKLTGTWTTRYWAIPSIGAISAPLPPEIDRQRSISGSSSRGRVKEEEEKRRKTLSPLIRHPRGEKERGN
ncbi:hypothetical protein BHE74_00053362, partial [Ensete ventricosum]